MSHPTRGKFLNTPAVPSVTAAPPTRGKFLNANTADVKASVAIAETSKKVPRVRMTPHSDASKKVLQDLDEAENLVLNLLRVASKTADSLGRMADDDCKDGDEDLSLAIQASGEEYLNTVKKIHALLSPHARKVVPYTRKLNEDNSTKSDDQVKEGENDKVSQDKEIGSEKVDSSCTSMYAARVERTLAEERKNILHDMLDVLNEEESVDQEIKASQNEATDGVVVGTKRKAE